MQRFALTAGLLAASCAMLAAPAGAAQPKADLDGDGTITREEARGHPKLEKNFGAIDTDRDGRLSQEELQKARDKEKAKSQRKANAKFKEADRDGNGMLSRNEAQAIPRVAKNFDAMDANGDGQVSKDEIRRYDRPERSPRRESRP